MIWVLILGTEKRGLSSVVLRHDGEPVDVGQNGSNSGVERSGPAYILDQICRAQCVLALLPTLCIVPTELRLQFSVFWDLTSC